MAQNHEDMAAEYVATLPGLMARNADIAAGSTRSSTSVNPARSVTLPADTSHGPASLMRSTRAMRRAATPTSKTIPLQTGKSQMNTRRDTFVA